MSDKAAIRPRLAALAGVLLLAPVFAEYSSGYLSSTGDPVAMAGELLILVPLYGCPALLIRELATHQRLNWSGILLLAAAAGLVQAGVTDRSIFTLTGTEEDYWPDIMNPTWIDAWGVSVGAAFGWVLGHVITTFGAPLAVVERLVPAAAGRRLVGRLGVMIAALLYALSAVAVHAEIAKTYRPVPSVTQTAVVILVAALLVGLALAPWGRGGHQRHASATTGPSRRWVRLSVPVATGAATMSFVDQSSLSWPATAASVVFVIAAATALLTLARSSWWLSSSAALAGLGAMLARAVVAFQTPRADGVTQGEMLAHNAGFLLLVIALLIAVARRREPLTEN